MSVSTPPTGNRTPPEQLTNGGLTLRRWRLDDTNALYTAANSSIKELAPWMPWAANGYSILDADSFLVFATGAWDSREEFNYAIMVQDRVIGSCGLMKRNDLPNGFEIGYWVETEATGRGLATQATELLIPTGFAIGADRVQIRHKDGNVKSAAIPRRLGFTCLGLQDVKEIGEQIIWQLDKEPALPAKQ